MKNWWKIGLMIGLFLVSPVQAQEIAERETTRDILSETGKQIVFDAGEIVEDVNGYSEFHWDFGDGASAEGLGVLHSYVKPGFYEASLELKQEEEDKKIYFGIYVYNELFVAVVDQSVDQAKLSEVEEAVFDEGMLLWVVADEEAKTTDEVVDLVMDNQDIIDKSKGIMFWGAGNFGLDVLVQLGQRSDIDLADLNVINVSGQRFGNLRKTADSAFKLASPLSLILVNERAVDFVSYFDDIDQFADKLEEEGLSFEIIGIKDRFRLAPASDWSILTRLIDYALAKGVPLSTIVLILSMPIIALLIALVRSLFGVKAFGIYVPSLITLAFLESGLWYGTLVFVIVLAIGTLTRMLLRRMRILYLPRMALILTSVSLGLIVTMAIAAYFEITALKTLSIVPLLTMVVLTEKFISAQIRYGFRKSLSLTLETFVISVVCYLLVGWQTLRVLMISYPEWILLVIPILVIVGRWTGLRLTEYWRFRWLIEKK